MNDAQGPLTDLATETPAWPPRRSRRFLVAVALSLAIVGGGAFVLHTRQNIPSTPTARPAPVPVTTVHSKIRDLAIERIGLGTVTPVTQVDVRARIDGQLERLTFTEGQDVAAGDLLAEIDPRPYRAVLAQAEATLRKDEAQLRNARSDEARAAKLTASGAGTSQAADAARLQVAVLQATIAGDEAAIETAGLNLGYATIRAPISGRVGLNQVDAGALVRGSDATGIVTITQIDPIEVAFSVPQDELPDLLAGQAQAPMSVSVETRDQSKHLADGRLTVIDSQVDTTTGMVKLKAEFANADRRLWPGQLVSARIAVRTDRNVVVVPSIAVQNGQNGPYLFVVRPDDTVGIVQVGTGPSVGDLTPIASGLGPDADVVVSGQSRLADGTAVAVTQTDDQASQHIALETP